MDRNKNLGVFGLRYLEEEEAAMNDIVGCLAQSGGIRTTATTYNLTYSATSGCDENDYDSEPDQDDGGPLPV